MSTNLSQSQRREFHQTMSSRIRQMQSEGSQIREVSMTPVQSKEMQAALVSRIHQMQAIASNPTLVNQDAVKRINDMYRIMPDGVDASGAGMYDIMRPGYCQALQRCDKTPVIDVDYTIVEDSKTVTNQDLKDEQKMLPPEERAKATKKTVDQKVPSSPVGDKSFLSSIKNFMSWNTQDTEDIVKAKRAAAASTKTDAPRDIGKIVYEKDTCTSQGESIKYNVAWQKVDWGRALKERSSSIAETVERLSSYITNAVRDNYGGWGRITEIIVRDQKLIINRACFRPLIDPKTIDAGLFPIDTIEYLKEGAIGSFFDWSMLKHMRNLRVLDVDDLGFYENQIGGRLKCGRRIGVSTLFNLCPNLELLILGGDAVSRDDLSSDKSTKVKKRLADHKRFSLFSDGYKLEICKNTDALSKWTFGNMTSYACNRGNRGWFRYCAGLSARAVFAGAAGALSLGTHLVGGIKNVFKEAMTPVSPDEIGGQ